LEEKGTPEKREERTKFLEVILRKNVSDALNSSQINGDINALEFLAISGREIISPL
jgi:hypothetical protein